MDSEYLKRHVGKALSEGLAEVCLKRPSDPVEYLAFWLRKYVENQAYNDKQHEEAVKLAKEREIAEKEALYRARMKEEAEFLAKQEAYARAAAEPVVIDTTPRPMPPELNQTLETVTEQGEEDEPTVSEEQKSSNVEVDSETQAEIDENPHQDSSLTQIPEETSEAVADGNGEVHDGNDEVHDGNDGVHDGNDDVVDENDQNAPDNQS